MDGRLFLNSTGRHFDVIILNLPDPQTAQINRFYTEEFFHQVSRHLRPNGVFGFQVRASEEYLSPTTAELLRCLAFTLRKVFPDVATIPGETVHFLAAEQAGVLDTDPEQLARRISERNLQTMFVSPYFLPFRMSRERRDELEEQLRATAETRVNRDFNPIAYFMSVELWSTQFSPKYRTAFQAIARTESGTLFAVVSLVSVLMAGLISWTHDSERRMRGAIGFAVALMGLMLMTSQIVLLLGFQAVFGYVFDELAIIIAGFMAGMAGGAWLALASPRAHDFNGGSEAKKLLLTQIAAIVLVLVLTPAITYLGGLSESGHPALVIHAVFLLLAGLSGLVGGYQFPAAMRLFSGGREPSQAPGFLYGFDLIGAAGGAIAISVFLLPLFGFVHTAELVAVANLGPIILLAIQLKGASRSTS
jgi:spermidine synthase